MAKSKFPGIRQVGSGKTWMAKLKDPATGRWRLRTTHCKQAANAWKKREEWARKLEDGVPWDELEEAVAKPLSHYCDLLEKSLIGRGNTARWVTRLIARIKFCFTGIDSIKAISEPVVMRNLARLKNPSANTQTHYRKAARQLSRWLWLEGFLQSDPLIRMPSTAKGNRVHIRRILTPDELCRFFNVAPRENQITYTVALHTGFRVSELRSLRRADFDLDAEIPSISLAGSKTKNRRPAVQPIRKDVAAVLKQWIEEHDFQPDEPVLYIQEGSARMVRSDLKRAGIPYRDAAGHVFDFHCLRSQYISALASAGVPVVVTQRLARHGDPRLTLSVYAKVDQSEQAKAVENLPPAVVLPFRKKSG